MRAENIILAFDFSESSEMALELATSLARELGARLHIVHVKEPFKAYKLAGKYGEVPHYPELDTVKSVLENVVPADPNIPCRHWLFTSEHAAKEILNLASELDADMIVMGTHGRSGVSRLLLGSVAESVIRQAECPILTVKSPRLTISEPMPAAVPS